jgi:predicted  nucleic acid-binding Zn-ribbon protein
MSLFDLQNRISRALSDRGSQSSDKQQPSTIATREDRAQVVLQLQNEVHRLQHEIAALSQAPQLDVVAVENGTTEAEQRRLQQQLTETQQSLAKLQGRV